MVTETGDAGIPYLITAPTMRIPTNFNIDTSVNAYLAMKAILVAARQHERIDLVAIPGLCTGVGRMQPSIAAKQMYQAYREIVMGEWVAFKTFGEAQKRHWNLNQNSMIWTH